MKVNKMRIEALERDEAQAKSFGIKTKYLPLSLSCAHHRNLHGELLSVDRVRQLYAIENVQDDCKCALCQIPLDDRGEPLSTSVIEKAKSQISESNL